MTYHVMGAQSHRLTCNAVGMIDFGGDDVLVVSSVEIGAPDRLDFVVGPIDEPIHRVVIDGDGVLDAVQTQHHV